MSDANGENAKIAAWVLARTGQTSDLESLPPGRTGSAEPLTKAYFEHALATLGDPEGLKALLRNLGHADANVRVYAAEFRARGPSGRGERDAHPPARRLRARRPNPGRPGVAPPGEASTCLPSENFSRNVFPATVANPRYSEGSVLVRRDGSLIYATTEFQGSGSDFAKASNHRGRLPRPGPDLERAPGAPGKRRPAERDVRHPARLSPANAFDGPIGLFYLVKNSPTDLDVYLRVSNDEAKTFGEPLHITTDPGYHVLNNDRVTVLSTGRILVPIATTQDAVNKAPSTPPPAITPTTRENLEAEQGPDPVRAARGPWSLRSSNRPTAAY